jgi:hypothetical protein
VRVGSKTKFREALLTLCNALKSAMGNTALRSSNKNYNRTSQQLPYLPAEIWAMIFKKLTVSQLLKYENIFL